MRPIPCAAAPCGRQRRTGRSHPRTGTLPITNGEGYAIGHLDDLGDGPGFRKVRKGLDVTAFGVNAIVMPPGIETGFHYHDVQEELYFVHRGVIEMEFGDGSIERLQEGAFARVDAGTRRKLRNVGDTDAVYLCAGGKDGYVGRDGHALDAEQRVGPIPGSGEGGHDSA